MPDSSHKKSGHYFSSHPTSDMNLRKYVTSVRNQLLTFQTASEVFCEESLDLGTRTLIENIYLPKQGPVLDLGAGYGPIAIWLQKEFTAQLIAAGNPPKIDVPLVYASEINERAIWLLNRNLVGNELKGKTVRILKGDFIQQVELVKKEAIQFQAVYTNPPFKLGHKVLLDLFAAAVSVLAPDGFIQYVHKKSLGAEGLMQKLLDLYPDWFVTPIKKHSGYYVIVMSHQEFEDNDPRLLAQK